MTINTLLVATMNNTSRRKWHLNVHG